MPLPVKLSPSGVTQRDDEEEASGLPWHLSALRIDKLAAKGITGSGVRIGVIDSGVYSSRAFVNARIESYTRSGEEGGDDDFGHGTSMIGILVGEGTAVCRDATIVSIRAFSANGGATAAWIAEGIHTALAKRVDIISVSGGQPSASQTLTDAVKCATDLGVVFVASADNENPDEPLYPASVPSAIAVTSSDDHDELVYPAPPNWVDIAAPGVDIATVSWHEPVLQSGTSEATAIVAGVCGLILGEIPTKQRRLVGKHLLAFLAKTARPAANASGPGDCGIIQPSAALAAVKNWLSH